MDLQILANDDLHTGRYITEYFALDTRYANQVQYGKPNELKGSTVVLQNYINGTVEENTKINDPNGYVITSKPFYYQYVLNFKPDFFVFQSNLSAIIPAPRP